MTKKLLRTVLIVLVMTLNACTGSQFEYSNRACYLMIDNATHQNASLANAMTPYSNVFVTITQTMRGGVSYFNFVSNQGGGSTESIFNAIDNRRSQMIGMNNGVIVGYAALSDPLTFYAYDRECPNCFNPDNLPVRSYPLTTTSNGLATCNTCKRQYDMNNGGLVVSGTPGNKLTRYHAETSGSFGVLYVH